MQVQQMLRQGPASPQAQRQVPLPPLLLLLARGRRLGVACGACSTSRCTAWVQRSP